MGSYCLTLTLDSAFLGQLLGELHVMHDVMHEMLLMLTTRHSHTFDGTMRGWTATHRWCGNITHPPCVLSPILHEWLAGTGPANSHTSVVAAGRLRWMHTDVMQYGCGAGMTPARVTPQHQQQLQLLLATTNINDITHHSRQPACNTSNSLLPRIGSQCDPRFMQIKLIVCQSNEQVPVKRTRASQTNMMRMHCMKPCTQTSF